MKCRCLASLSVMVLAIGLTVVLVAPLTMAGQAPSAQPRAAAATAAKPWTGKTPDGHPDLQGFWTNNAYTPLQRAANSEGILHAWKSWSPTTNGARPRKQSKQSRARRPTSITTLPSSLWIAAKHGSPESSDFYHRRSAERTVASARWRGCSGTCWRRTWRRTAAAAVVRAAAARWRRWTRRWRWRCGGGCRRLPGRCTRRWRSSGPCRRRWRRTWQHHVRSGAEHLDRIPLHLDRQFRPDHDASRIQPGFSDRAGQRRGHDPHRESA